MERIQFDRPIAAFQLIQMKLATMLRLPRANCWRIPIGRKIDEDNGFLNSSRQDEQRRHCARYRTCGSRHSRRKRVTSGTQSRTHEQFGIGQDLRRHPRHFNNLILARHITGIQSFTRNLK